MAIVVLNGPTITAGESLSDALDCSAGEIVKLTMPFQWAGTKISFQSSSDGNGYNDLMHADGTEITATVFGNTAVIGLGLVRGFVKIRSGTRDQPVVQAERRDFAIAIDTGPTVNTPGNELRVRLLGGFAP